MDGEGCYDHDDVAECFVQDFDELIQMASRGDHTKVDFLSGDLKNRSRSDTDWYSMMGDNLVVFALGKMSEEIYDGY